jgi:hypothetical protein
VVTAVHVADFLDREAGNPVEADRHGSLESGYLEGLGLANLLEAWRGLRVAASAEEDEP